MFSSPVKMTGLIIIAILILAPHPVFSANHYILSGGTGDGSSWDNALNDLPSSFVRGDIYYIGDGTYGPHTFDTAISGATYVYIKKATISDHGDDTGWNNSYGDGQAVFYAATGDIFRVSTSYWDFNGQVGGGPGSWEEGFGFVLRSSDTTTSNKLFNITSGNDYINVKHVEFACPGEDNEGLSQDGFYAANPRSTNLYIGYSFFHDVTRNFITLSAVSDVLIEYSVFTRRHTTNNSPHGQGIQIGPGLSDNITIRYSRHYDQYSTAFICPLDNSHEYIYVYGNEFWINNNSRYLVSNGVLANTSGDTANHWRFFNNVIWNVKGSSQAGIPLSSGSDNLAYNNLWLSSNTPSFNNWTHDYNAEYNTGSWSENNIQSFQYDPTVNSSIQDFRLTEGTYPGMPLNSPFNKDMFSVIRGVDGLWDRGAFEFVNGDIPPKAPTELTISY